METQQAAATVELDCGDEGEGMRRGRGRPHPCPVASCCAARHGRAPSARPHAPPRPTNTCALTAQGLLTPITQAPCIALISGRTADNPSLLKEVRAWRSSVVPPPSPPPMHSAPRPLSPPNR